MQSLTHLTYDTSVNCVSVDFSDKVKKKKKSSCSNKNENT